MKNRKVVAFILTLSLVFSPFSVSFAATETTAASTNPVTFSDVTAHWGAAAISKWSGYGIINGYEGLFRPDDPITRGEMAVILDNMMDYQEVAANTFNDLQAGQFYTDAVLKANAAGIVKGDGVTVRPTDKITKEEAAIMMSRAFAVSESNSTKAFLDASAVSEWAKGAVFGMEAKGYVSGFGGYFNPKSNITRAEAVTMINNIVKAYYTAAGTYTDDVAGTAVIKVADVILKGVTVSENLIIAEGVAQGDATLDSVTVKGETVIRGGGENSVHITGNSVITKVTIEKVGDKLRVVIDDGITVTNVEVAVGEEIIITGSVGTVELNAPGAIVYANAAEINSATITGNNSTIVVGAQSTLNNVNVSNSAGNTTIRTETGAVVGAITASSEVEVSGTGTVSKVTLQAGADGSSVTTPNTATTVPTGVTGVTGGGGTSIPAGSTGTNSSTGTTATVATNTTPTGGGGGGGGSSTVAVTEITVTSSAITITSDNGTLQMSAVIAPTNASNQNVTWSVTNGTGYATINSSGLLTAVSDGTVTVSAVSVSNGTVSGSLGITLSNQVLDAITTAGATRTSPAVGEPGASATVSASANYTHTSTVWSGKAGANYAVGETPAAIITLEAKTGYTFTGLAAGSVTVAGGTVTYDAGGPVSGGAFLVFTVTYPQLTAAIASATATCTSPAIGEAGASAAVSGSANYTLASTTWSGRSGGTFAAGETPAAIVTLTAKAGYGFTGLLASNITVAGGTVSYGAGQGVTAGGLSVVFTVTYSQLVGTLSAATVTVTAPALGVTPSNAAAVEAATSNANYTVSSVTWNGTQTSTGKFKADTAYSATIVLTSKNFYKFQAGAFTPTVASALSVGTTTTVGTAIGNTASFTASFTSTGALTVSSITVTTQPTNLSYMESAALGLNGMVITETNNDSSTEAAVFADGTNADYTANPANGTTMTTAYNGTPVAITHIGTGKVATTAALTVLSTVSAISGTNVTLTAGSIVFDYDFTGTSGAISYAQGQLAPYYLNPVASTVTLTNGISSTSAVSLSALGISDDGVVSYGAITSIGAVFTGLYFIPSQVVINLVGATSVNGGSNQWTYNIGVNLDMDEIGLLTPDPITAVAVSITAPAIGVALENAEVAPGDNCSLFSTSWYDTGSSSNYAPGASPEAGDIPIAIISLAADTDYTFAELTAGGITVAGGTVSFEAGQGVTTGGMAVTFTVSYSQLIDTITTVGAICTKPGVGTAAPYFEDAIPVDGSKYSHIATSWSGDSGVIYAAGDIPTAVVTLAAITGYTFDGITEAGISVSGGIVSFDTGQGVTSAGGLLAFTVTYPQLKGATLSNVIIAGTVNNAITDSAIDIEIIGDTLDSTIAASTDLSAWFINLPAGLSAVAQAEATSGSTSVAITISGTPTVAANEAVEVTIPGSSLSGGADITATFNTNARYAIASAAVGNVTISGTVGNTITSKDVVITLAGDTISAMITAGDNLASWITNLPTGLSAVAQTDAAIGATSVTITVSGTPAVAAGQAITIVVPASALTNGIPVTATANADAKYVIAGTASVGDVLISGTKNTAITSKDVVITLTGDTFKAISTGTNLAGWITNIPSGLTAVAKSDVSDGSTTATISVSDAPTVVLNQTLSVTIPAINLNSGVNIAVASNANAKFVISEATLGNVDVEGWSGNAITDTDVVITLTNDTFKAISTSTDLASWITNLPAGLSAVAKADVLDGDTSATITVSGTPTEGILQAIAITIPSASLNGGIDTSATSNANARFMVAGASITDVTIVGSVSGGTLSPTEYDVVITLNGDSFNTLIPMMTDDLTSWINLPAGLDALAAADVLMGATSITLSVGNTPLATSSAQIVVTIPASVLVGGHNITTTINMNAVYNIAP